MQDGAPSRAEVTYSGGGKKVMSKCSRYESVEKHSVSAFIYYCQRAAYEYSNTDDYKLDRENLIVGSKS